MTSGKRLQTQEASFGEQPAELDRQARDALATGNEQLARAGLERKQAIEGELGSLDQQVAQLE